jgi:hypothetical protein
VAAANPGAKFEASGQQHKLATLSVAGKMVNTFAQIVHTAFSMHHPLRITPDAIWFCLSQSFANHINQNAKTLQNKIVSFEGKKEIEIFRDQFVKGNPNNDWQGCFPEFSSQIKSHIGDELHSSIVANFSTTGPVERAVSEIVLMDSMQSFFDYVVHTRCGIPSFYITGTKSDWSAMRQKIPAWSKIDPTLADWVKALDQILSEFESAFDGKTNDLFWDSIYKYHSGSGGASCSGWINNLFLYIQTKKGHLVKHNPASQPWDSKTRGSVKPNQFPGGFSMAPFTWKYLGAQFPMAFVGGIVGATQDADLTLTPTFSWFVFDKSVSV